MAPAPFWRGFLRLALVTCPVALTPATSEREAVRFNTLNRTTGNRVQSRYLDAESGETVERWDQVKGYPVGRDEYVMVEEDELKGVRLESVNVLDVTSFVPAGEVAPIWRETPYLLTPDGDVGQEAFSVIREAMKASGTVGLSKWVRTSRERPIMLEPRGRGIVVWVLCLANEVRSAADVFGGIDQKASEKLVRSTEDLIDEMAGKWDRKGFKDPAREKLLDVIEAKKKGRAPPKPKPAPPIEERQTANIFDALRRSLKQAKERSEK